MENVEEGEKTPKNFARAIILPQPSAVPHFHTVDREKQVVEKQKELAMATAEIHSKDFG